MQCPQCKAVATTSAKFCSECGQRLLAAPKRRESQEFEDRDTQVMRRPDFIMDPGQVPNQIRKKIDRAQENLAGARRLVTILFADVQGFTTLCEKLDPESVTDLMNMYFGKLGEIVYEFEGYVDKFMGDAVMALFGAPVAHDNDPELALRAAMKFISEIDRLNAVSGHPLSIRIGVNSGMVIAGGVGSQQKFDFTVMGDVVNIAQRLQSIAEPNQILVGKSVQVACRSIFDFVELHKQTLKGKSTEIEVFRVHSFRKREFAERGVREQQLKLIGREAEMNRLQMGIQALKDSHPKALLIWGDPGTGKSRLKLEMRAQALKERIRWIEARGSELKTESAFFPIRVILQQLLKDFIEIDSDSKRPRLASMESLGLDQISKVFLEDILQIQAMPSTMDAHQKRKGMFQTLRALFEALGTRSRFIAFLDDFHFVDPPTRELWTFLSEGSKNYWLIAAARDRELERLDDLHLTALNDADSIELVKALLRSDTIPRDLELRILERCQGNPLFIEEMVKSLLESGALRRQQDRWELIITDASVQLPQSIQAILGARLDRLYPSDREVLEVASVFGRNFRDDLLRKVLSNREGIDESLQFLRKRELIFEVQVNAAFTEYAFNQILTQQVAYQSILKKRLRVLHRRVAEVLEQDVRDGVRELYSEGVLDLLAHHFTLAETEPVRAAFYWRRLAEMNRRQTSLYQARASLERGLSTLQDRTDEASAKIRFELKIDLSEMGILSGEFSLAESHLLDLKKMGILSQDERITLGTKLSDLYRKMGKHAEAEAEVFAISESDQLSAAEQVRAHFYRARGQVHRQAQRWNEALADFQNSMKLAQMGKHSHLLTEVLNDIGATLIQAGQLPSARTGLTKAIEGAQLIKDKLLEIRALLNLGALELLEGKSEEALRVFERVNTYARELGDLPDQVMALHNQGLAAIQIQRWDTAENSLTECRELASRLSMSKELNSSEELLKSIKK